MDKRIGKFFLIGFLLLPLIVSAQPLQVCVTDTDGQTTQQLHAGVSYLLEVKAEGTQNLNNVVIDGIDTFYHEFRGASRITMMSQITTQHTYLIRADKTGTFTIGPAQIIKNTGEVIRSNTLKVVVTQQQNPDVIVHVTPEKNRIVVGEKILLTTSLLTRVQAELLSFQQPKLDPTIGTITEMQQKSRGTKTIDGVSYEFVEWEAYLTVQKHGKLVMPPLCALCKIPQKRKQRHDFFGSMLSYFDVIAKPQQCYSNELIIDIDPLPPYAGTINAIGVFSRYDLTINQEKAQVGEGIVVSLELEGKTDLSDIKAPALLLPDGIKYYESKAINHEPSATGECKKTFEYIIQGIKTGMYEIPSHLFVFYHTEAHRFETLQTKPLLLEITPPLQVTVQKQVQHYVPEDDDDIYPLQTNGPWLPQQERSLSWFWFFVTACIPLFYCFYCSGKEYRDRYNQHNKERVRKKNAFKYAKQHVRQLKNDDAAVTLREVFLQLFIDRLQIPRAELSAECIEKKLRQVGFSETVIEQWHRFFYTLEEQSYTTSKEKTSMQEYINRAQIWLQQLEEKL